MRGTEVSFSLAAPLLEQAELSKLGTSLGHSYTPPSRRQNCPNWETVCGTRLPLLREGGVAAPSRKWPRSLAGADGVVVSSHRLSKHVRANLSGSLKQPPRPLLKGTGPSSLGRVHPSFAKEGYTPASSLTMQTTPGGPSKPVHPRSTYVPALARGAFWTVLPGQERGGCAKKEKAALLAQPGW